jgi:putative oxidoreductase
MLFARFRMQRLFSAFPNSWPGSGLLILRVAAAASSILSGFSATLPGLPVPLLQGAAAATSALLLLGLWTPLAGLLQVSVELTSGLGHGTLDINHALLSALGLGLAMIGPGSWSLDARLFGRKRIDLNIRKD